MGRTTERASEDRDRSDRRARHRPAPRRGLVTARRICTELTRVVDGAVRR